MSLIEQINSDFKQAMLNHDEVRKTTLNGLKSAIKYREVEKGAGSVLDDQEIEAVIAREVKSQNFHRNNVTEQAIHNELIKDDRFVLIGRGIYALAENGYKNGSITDVITELLKEHGPMYRDDIVREVLKMRQVRETTILLNLQSKPQFKRVAKNQYALAEQA